MKPALRNVGAVVVGVLAGSALNFALIQANTLFFPLPEGVTYSDQEAFAAYVAGLPDAAFVLPLIAHLAQAFVGGLIAARLGTRPVVAALAVGVLSLLGGIANALMIEPPAWMWLEMPLYLVLAWVAGDLERRRRAKG